MTVMHWKPFGDLVSMHGKINRLFEETFKDFEKEPGYLTSQWNPATDIFETKDEFVFKVEAPGLTKDDINVELTENTLSIKGEKKEDKKVKKEGYHLIESYCGTFSRSYSLPRNVNTKDIKANMKDGILELRIAKSEETKPKAISINVE